jgi:hypothetical protein
VPYQAGTLKSTYDDNHIAIEHLLLSLAMDHRCGKQLLSQASASTDKLKNVVQGIRGRQSATDQNPEGTYEFLETYGPDLTKAVELEYGTLAKLHKKLPAKEEELNTSGSDKTLLREEVTEDDISPR